MTADEVMDDWTGAVDYLRQHYDDTYQARIELAGDLREFGTNQDMNVPGSVSDEGVLQPLIRYQNVDPDDAWQQIESRAPAHHQDALRELFIAFAEADAGRHEESPDRGDIYDPCCEYDNPEEWGPTADRPIDDVAEDLKSSRERRAETATEEFRDFEVASDINRVLDDTSRPDHSLESQFEQAGVNPDLLHGSENPTGEWINATNGKVYNVEVHPGNSKELIAKIEGYETPNQEFTNVTDLTKHGHWIPADQAMTLSVGSRSTMC